MKFKKIFSLLPYLRKQLYWFLLLSLALWYLSIYWSSFEKIFLVFVSILGVFLIHDFIKLYIFSGTIECEREVSNLLSNGEENEVILRLKNTYKFPVDLEIEDEVPVELQMRNFLLHTILKAGETKELKYSVCPKKRGEYIFDSINIFVSLPKYGMLEKKVVVESTQACKVLPSFSFLHNIEFLSVVTQDQVFGAHKIPKLGSGSEFENIREYTVGDDYRKMNWKATARRHTLMVNQYTDQKCQDIYSVIDKGRGMQHTFDGLSLLDYSINSSVQLSYVALKHQDNAGLLTFENDVCTHLPSSRNMTVLHKMQELLYKEKTSFAQSDYFKLLSYTRSSIRKRSLFVIYTSFDSINSLKRQLPYIKQMAKSHVVLVVFFIDQDIYDLAAEPTSNFEENAVQMVAQNFIFEQKQIVRELQKRGIYSLLTHPKNLNTKVINKYLEFKARNII